MHTDFCFGFCNDTKSCFQPIASEIASNLIKSDFNIDIEQLKKIYKTSFYDNNINRFIHYIKERPYKKYYSYKTIKKRSFGENLYTPEEKIKYIKEYFKTCAISKNYDISINAPVSSITVDLIEK